MRSRFPASLCRQVRGAGARGPPFAHTPTADVIAAKETKDVLEFYERTPDLLNPLDVSWDPQGPQTEFEGQNSGKRSLGFPGSSFHIIVSSHAAEKSVFPSGAEEAHESSTAVACSFP